MKLKKVRFKDIGRRERDVNTPAIPKEIKYQQPIYDPETGQYDMAWRDGTIVGFAAGKAIVKTASGGIFEQGAKGLYEEDRDAR